MVRLLTRESGGGRWHRFHGPASGPRLSSRSQEHSIGPTVYREFASRPVQRVPPRSRPSTEVSASRDCPGVRRSWIDQRAFQRPVGASCGPLETFPGLGEGQTTASRSSRLARADGEVIHHEAAALCLAAEAGAEHEGRGFSPGASQAYPTTPQHGPQHKRHQAMVYKRRLVRDRRLGGVYAIFGPRLGQRSRYRGKVGLSTCTTPC
jgi:hypothetical protein